VLLEKAETVSTNDDARELALSGAPAGSAVLARSQTQGRGRAGRAFESTPGGMYLSVVLRPTLSAATWPLLPLAVAVESASVLRGVGFDARIKWPNDIMIAGRKVGGILVESRLGAEPYAIVGVGLNVESAPPEVEGATSLAEHGPVPDVRPLAVKLVEGFVARTRALEHGAAHATVAEVRTLCMTIGRRVEWDGEEGVAVDLAEDGALVVVDGKGARHRIVAGDVRVRQR
jgi:BirA family biotin operon repressor/biotin-[acetyl-CoA-carboxylase] ligase